MNKQNEMKITENIHDLAELTTNQSTLLNLLQQSYVISREERQNVMANSTEYNQMTSLYMTMTKKDDESFQKLITCLKNSGNQRIVNKLCLQDSDDIPCFKPDENLISFECYEPEPFYGEISYVEAIHNSVERALSQNYLRVACVIGQGGSGKSELAKIYCKVKWGNIGHRIWINAETEQTIRQSFVKLSDFLKISLKDDLGKEMSNETIITEICKILCTRKCLLIFDNADRVKSLDNLINTVDAIPEIFKPFILITSRCSSGIEASIAYLDKQITLTCFSEEYALQFFNYYLNPFDSNSETIGELKVIAKKLKYCPLAIKLAVALINIKGEKVNSNMNREIHKYYKKINVENGDEIICKTFGVTFDNIELNSKYLQYTHYLVYVLSFLNAENIDADFVDKIVKGILGPNSIPTTPKIEFFCILKIYSILSRLIEQEKKIWVSIHEPFQKVVRIRLEQENKLQDILYEIIDHVCNNLANVSSNSMSHVETIWRHAINYGLVMRVQNFADKIAQKYSEKRKYRDGYRFSCDATDKLCTLLGNDFKSTLRMTHWKGIFLMKLLESDEGHETIDDVHGRHTKLIDEQKKLIERKNKTIEEQKKLIDEQKKLIEELKRKKFNSYCGGGVLVVILFAVIFKGRK